MQSWKTSDVESIKEGDFVGGHSFIFFKYVYDNDRKIIGMYFYDNSALKSMRRPGITYKIFKEFIESGTSFEPFKTFFWCKYLKVKN